MEEGRRRQELAEDVSVKREHVNDGSWDRLVLDDATDCGVVAAEVEIIDATDCWLTVARLGFAALVDLVQQLSRNLLRLRRRGRSAVTTSST